MSLFALVHVARIQDPDADVSVFTREENLVNVDPQDACAAMCVVLVTSTSASINVSKPERFTTDVSPKRTRRKNLGPPGEEKEREEQQEEEEEEEGGARFVAS